MPHNAQYRVTVRRHISRHDSSFSAETCSNMHLPPPMTVIQTHFIIPKYGAKTLPTTQTRIKAHKTTRVYRFLMHCTESTHDMQISHTDSELTKQTYTHLYKHTHVPQHKKKTDHKILGVNNNTQPLPTRHGITSKDKIHSTIYRTISQLTVTPWCKDFPKQCNHTYVLQHVVTPYNEETFPQIQALLTTHRIILHYIGH